MSSAVKLIPQRTLCALLLQYFAHLDADGSGTLSMDELWAEHRRVVAQQQKQQEARPTTLDL